MGNLCSCLHNKIGDSTYLYPPGQASEPESNNRIINPEMVKGMKETTPPPMKTGEDLSRGGSHNPIKGKSANSLCKIQEENDHKNYIQETYNPRIEKLIGYFKMRYFQKHFKQLTNREIKKETIELYEKYVKEHSNEYVIKAEQLYPPYNQTGWKKFYNKNESFQPQYVEMLFDNIVLFSYDRENDKIVKDNDTLIISATSVYYGQCDVRLKKNGYGTLLMKDGTKYIGWWENNVLTGWSRIIDSRGTILQGVFQNGLLNGKGELISLDGHKYEGDFANGLREGEGKEESKEMKYQGSFKKDKRCGQGEMSFPSGDVYKGEFENHYFHGQGHYIWKANGHQYIGSYFNNQMHGKGLYKWSEDEYYNGEYVNGIKEGNGEFKWRDGRRYKGSFKNGVPDGTGICEYPDGKIKEVHFMNGKPFKTNNIKSGGDKDKNKDKDKDKAQHEINQIKI